MHRQISRSSFIYKTINCPQLENQLVSVTGIVTIHVGIEYGTGVLITSFSPAGVGRRKMWNTLLYTKTNLYFVPPTLVGL